MTERTFENHIQYCDLRLGTLLSANFEDNDPAILVAKKLMVEMSKTKIYLGKAVLKHFKRKLEMKFTLLLITCIISLFLTTF